MIELRWSGKALEDLSRLHQFLRPVNRRAAAATIQALVAAPHRLLDLPRLGERLQGFEEREVRRLFVGNYEMRYEIQDSIIHVLRVWHAREDR